MEPHCDFIAATAFGLEAVVKREAAALGLGGIKALDGRVDFTGGLGGFAKANIWLRSAERVLLKIGEFRAETFDELFEGTKALPWGDWITVDGKFTVTGKSVRSALHSVPDCQAIVKKAIVEKLKQKYSVDWFAETGADYTVQVALLKDVATLTIDTTGPGLHKRGYRPVASVAPIKETLAAALISLSYWKKGRVFFDPLCGSGTLPIEAALMAKNAAPGLKRRFVSETWPQIPAEVWKDAREEARAVIDTNAEPLIFGSDIDPSVVETARANAERAGVGDIARFEVKALKDASLQGQYGVAVCNPPYAERLGTAEEVELLYRQMRGLFEADDTWSLNVITPDEFFEKAYGRAADSKRKLFNGRIKTDYYQYHGRKPPR